MKLDIFKIDGTKSGESIELNPNVFEIEPNDHSIYLYVKAYLAHQRQGTSKAKERSEVRGGGKKPWRQKGRGGARAGSIRSPLWIGGGTIFGPKPRTYDLDLPKKVKVLAKKSALSYKAKENSIIVVEDFSFEKPKTKELVSIFDALKIKGTKTAVVLGKEDVNIYKSGRNIPKVVVNSVSNISTYDLINAKLLLIQKSALEQINTKF